MYQDNYGYICLFIQGVIKEDVGWYIVLVKNEVGIVFCIVRLDVYIQWYQQLQSIKLKKVWFLVSCYVVFLDQGLDIKVVF